MKKTLNLAHRGFSGKYPENTMLAFKKAYEAGCDGFETDVQLSKDGVLVLCHDETLDRTTTGTGYLNNYTYEELLTFDAGIKFNEEFKGEKIPTFEELLAFCKEKNLFLNLELKNTELLYEGMEEKILDLIEKYNFKDNIIYSSFNHYSMVKLKELDPTVKTGLLYDAGLYHPENYCLAVGADAVHPHYFSVMFKEIVDDIKKKNVLINTYTVNKKEHMKVLLDLGIDSIITNYPDVLCELMNNC